MRTLQCILVTIVIGLIVLTVPSQGQNFWQSASIPNVNAGISDIAVDSSGYIFAAASASSQYAGVSVPYVAGLYRSTNSGTSWTRLDSSPMKSYFYCVAVGPNGSIYAGSYYGRVYRSNDDGNTWKIDSIKVGSIVTSFAFRSGGEVLASTAEDGIYSSTNGGTSWSRLPTSPSSIAPIVSVTVDAQQDLFLSTYGSGVYRLSKNDTLLVSQGLSGNRVNQVVVASPGAFYAATDNGVYFSDSVVIDTTSYVRPETVHVWVRIPNLSDSTSTSVDTLLAGSVVMSVLSGGDGHVLAGTLKNGAFRSTDNGAHWQHVNTGLTVSDIHVLAMNSAGYVFCGGLAGNIFMSTQPEPVAPRIQPSIAAVQPSLFKLEPCYPNPFNPTTTIPFSLSIPGFVTMKVYNSLGEQVATLISNYLSAGEHRVKWDGSAFSDGVYFYRLQSASYAQSGKLVLLK